MATVGYAQTDIFCPTEKMNFGNSFASSIVGLQIRQKGAEKMSEKFKMPTKSVATKLMQFKKDGETLNHRQTVANILAKAYPHPMSYEQIYAVILKAGQ